MDSLIRREYSVFSNKSQCFFFALFRKHGQEVQKFLVGVLFHLFAGSTLGQVHQGCGAVVILAAVGLGGGHAVAEHFLDVTVGHRHGHDFLRCHFVVVPEFKMMLVSALVMHPGQAVTCIPTLSIVRRFLSGIIFATGNEFRGAVLGKIVEKPLETDTRLEAEANHFVPVPCDGNEMSDRVKHERKFRKERGISE